MYTDSHIHKRINTWALTQIHTCTHTVIHAYIGKTTYKQTRTHRTILTHVIHRLIHTDKIGIDIQKHIYPSTYIHKKFKHIHTYIQKCIYMHACTHNHTKYSPEIFQK